LINTLKKLKSDLIVYGLGGALINSIHFFMLPVYTRLFNPEQFGEIEMVLIVTGLLKIFYNLGLDSAQSILFYKYKLDQKRLISSILQYRLIFGGGILFLSFILFPLVNKLILNNSLSNSFFIIAFLGCFFNLIAEQCAQVFRLSYKPKQYLAINIITSLFSSLFIIIFSYIIGNGILGYFQGFLLGGIFAMVYGIYKAREYISLFKLNSFYWKSLFKFGIPLVGSGFSFYVLNSADRWFINWKLTSHDLGLYVVAFKFSAILMLFGQTFRMAWNPIAFNLIRSEDDNRPFFQLVSKLYLGFGVALALILTLFSKLLVLLVTTKEYYDAFPLVGVLCFGSILYGFYPTINLGFWKKQKTHLDFLATSVGAISNVILNYIFIQKFGVFGVALATTLSQFIWIITTMYISESLWKINYPYFRFLLVGVVGFGSSIIIIELIKTDSYIIGSLVTLVGSVLSILFTIGTSEFKKNISLLRKYKLY
tara:strand:+ start:3019 stop:4461 length:1443 start_codon:yes stop_codon:yes gene_type:complete